jgi:CDGSH-type Zn-finger protein
MAESNGSQDSAKSSTPVMKIVVSNDGPYIVSGGVPLVLCRIVSNEEGYSWDWLEEREFSAGPVYKLCRCGRSGNKPFCDDSHLKEGFDGTETASRQPFSAQAKTYGGPTLELADFKVLCASARFCHPGGNIWSLVTKADPASRDLAIREAARCPSGRLVLRDREGGGEIKDAFEPSICVVEDSPLGYSGPLWVRGEIRVESEDGKPYELRNRATLCRCGASKNKPFCNGGHAVVKFRDGLVDLAPSEKVR